MSMVSGMYIWLYWLLIIKLTLSWRMCISFQNFRTNSLQSITKKGVAVEFKDKSSGNTINQSSTPSAISSASFTNWTQPFLTRLSVQEKQTIRNHSNYGTNDTVIWGTITWNSWTIQIWWMGWILNPRSLWIEAAKYVLWASDTVNLFPRKQKVSQQYC